jgi:hypothetical protein
VIRNRGGHNPGVLDRIKHEVFLEEPYVPRKRLECDDVPFRTNCPGCGESEVPDIRTDVEKNITETKRSDREANR